MAAKGVVNIPAIEFAMLCPITTATVPFVDREESVHGGGQAARDRQREQLGVSTNPSTCMTWVLVSVIERDSATDTPTPSRMRAGTATANNVSGTSAPTKQKTNPTASDSTTSRLDADDREDARPDGPHRLARRRALVDVRVGDDVGCTPR